MKRWPELKLLKPGGLVIQRAKVTSEKCVTNYFKTLDGILSKYNLKDKLEGIYNVDEKGLSTSHKPPNVVSSSCLKPPVNNSCRQTITGLCCGGAQGQQVPTYFIFPYKRFNNDLVKGATTGTGYIMTESGWSNMSVFQSYLENHLIKHLPERSPDNPVLLLCDGYSSHVSIPTIDWAKENNIVLFALPAHTSHVLQPMDVGCFGPFENIYNHECHKYIRMSQTKAVSKYEIQSNLVISNSLISNHRLSRSENLVPVLT